MFNYILKRLMSFIPTILLLIIVSFFLMRLAPGGPFTAERPLPESVMKNVIARYGLDQPLWKQLLDYIYNIVFHFDFGPSFAHKDRTVNDIIAQGFPVTLTYGFWSAVFVIVTGVPLGIIAALRHNGWVDYFTTGLAIFAQVFPNFVMAPLLILFFGLTLGWLPLGGWNDGHWQNIILPAVALGTSYMAGVARLMRGSMIETLNSPFIRTARAKGLSEKAIIWRHALKPAILPVLSYLGPVFAYMICGSIFIDVFFSTGGVGQDLISSVFSRDYSVLLGLTIVYGTAVFTFNLMMDILFAWIDPKLRASL